MFYYAERCQQKPAKIHSFIWKSSTFGFVIQYDEIILSILSKDMDLAGENGRVFTDNQKKNIMMNFVEGFQQNLAK